MRQQACIFREPRPVDPIENCMGQFLDRLILEMLKACENAA